MNASESSLKPSTKHFHSPDSKCRFFFSDNPSISLQRFTVYIKCPSLNPYGHAWLSGSIHQSFTSPWTPPPLTPKIHGAQSPGFPRTPWIHLQCKSLILPDMSDCLDSFIHQSGSIHQSNKPLDPPFPPLSLCHQISMMPKSSHTMNPSPPR